MFIIILSLSWYHYKTSCPLDHAPLILCLIGAMRGCQVLDRTVAELQQRVNTNPDNPQMGVVRLSGLVHADDRAAFQEIARQLCM